MTKLGTRASSSSILLVLFGSLVLPLLLLSSWVSYQTYATLERNTSLLTMALDMKAQVNDLLPLLLEQDDATKAMLIDPNTLEKYSSKKIEAYDKHHKLLDHLYETTARPELRAVIDRLRKLDTETLRPVDTQILEMIFDNLDKARTNYFANYDPNRATYEATLYQLIGLVSADADRLTSEIRAENFALTKKVIVALAVGLCAIAWVIIVLARQLQRSKSNMQILLSSLSEGMFYFDEHGVIAAERTEALERILPGSQPLKTIGEICAKAAGTKPESVAMCLKLLWPKEKDDGFFSDFASTMSFLPSSTSCLIDGESRTLLFDYRPQYAADQKTLQRVIVVVTDVTVKLRLERDAMVQAERVRKLAKASTNIESFMDFRKEVIGLFVRADAEFARPPTERCSKQLKRDLHTIKGTVGTFEFAGLAAEVHALETLLDDPPDHQPEQAFQAKWDLVKDMWKFEATDIDQVLGLERARTRFTVSAAAYRHLYDSAAAAADGATMQTLAKLRCFPLRDLFAHYEQYLLKLCERRIDKQIRFTYQEDSADLSFEEVQRIDGPLIHLFRNCLDHGIEDMEARKKSGKATIGTVHIAAFRTQAKMLHLVLKDDGGGVDSIKLGRKAVAGGLWTEEVFAKASPQEMVELMFASGLSTAEQVTDTSGRGVGMDAVRTMLEAMGGKITVYSQRGVGTQFEIDVPLHEPWLYLAPPLQSTRTLHLA